MNKTVIVGIIVFLVAAQVCLAVKPQVIWSNTLDDLDAITAAGGSIDGSAAFSLGIDKQAVNLTAGSSVIFPSVGNLPTEGTITFWFQPNYNFLNQPFKTTSGLLETLGYPGPNSFGVWVYKSEYGPVVVFEAKTSEGKYRQAWSSTTPIRPNYVYPVAITWHCNTPTKNFIRSYVNGAPGKVEIGVCRSMDLLQKGLRLGENSYYPSLGQEIDKVKIYDKAMTPAQIRAEIRKDIKIAIAQSKNASARSINIAPEVLDS